MAAVVGLSVYLIFDDWVVAAFGLLIVFPLARIVSNWLHDRVLTRAERRGREERSREALARLSPAEKEIVRVFVDEGGAVLSWSRVNALGMGGPAFDSLLARGLIVASVAADGIRETFVLDSEIFDIALLEPHDRPD